MSHFRSSFRLINSNNSYQVSSYGPQNKAFSTFSPADIAGLSGWWDASDDTHITGSGNNVTNWSNKGTAGGVISGSSGALITKIPLYKNNRQALYFSTSSASSFWETSAYMSSLDGSTTKCWFIVFQSNPTDNKSDAKALPNLISDRYQGIVLSEGEKNTEVGVPRWYYGSDTGYTSFLSSSNTTGRAPVSGTNFILNVIAKDTNLGATHQLTMSINGGSDEKRTSTAFIRDTASWPFNVGSTNPTYATSGPRNRYWYEILFYTGTLTSTERTKIINYLNDKWAIY